MPMIIAKTFTWHRPFSALPADKGGDIIIARGSPVIKGTVADGKAAYWLDPETFEKGTIEYSDLQTHGCYITPDNVEVTGDVKDLGYMNGWSRPWPEEYVEHQRLTLAGEKHHMDGRSIGRCCSETICYACRIKWKVDSSD